MRNPARLLFPCVLIAAVGCGPGPTCGADVVYNETTGLCECRTGGTWGDDGYCRYADGAITLPDGAIPMVDAGSGADDGGLLDAGPLDAGADVEPDACAINTFYRDADGDGHGAATDSVTACVAPEGYVESDDDCNDACETCLPGGTEVCTEPALDENCSGQANEVSICACTDGTSISCGTTDVGVCAFGSQQCVDGELEACEGAIDPVGEVCNGMDDDCDGIVDEGVRTTFYRDADGDSYGNASVTMQACSAPAGHVVNSSDCNDSCEACYPGADEVCDEVDNNCVGGVDEGSLDAFYADCDRDGFAPSRAVALMACSAPSAGPVSCSTGGWTMTVPVAGAADCADQDVRAFPGQTMYFDTPIPGVPATRDFDFNCDGTETRGVTRTNVSGCGGSGSCYSRGGWSGSSIPACGVSAEQVSCLPGATPSTCFFFESSGAQTCR